MAQTADAYKASLFEDRQALHVRALLVAERIDLRAIELGPRLGVGPPLAIRAGRDGVAVLFRYGAVVLYELSALEEANFLEQLTSFLISPLAVPVVDTLEVGVDADRPERFESDGRLMLQAANTERLQVVADVLAKSVVLDHYEQRVADAFDQVEPIAVDLQRFGSSRRRGRALLAHIGTTLLIQHMMVGRAEILESPEILWEHPEFERLYLRLRDEYDLRERQMAIERKLEVISRTAETELELLQNKRSLRVEWYIVILIVVEIVIMLYYEIFPHL